MEADRTWRSLRDEPPWPARASDVGNNHSVDKLQVAAFLVAALQEAALQEEAPFLVAELLEETFLVAALLAEAFQEVALHAAVLHTAAAVRVRNA